MLRVIAVAAGMASVVPAMGGEMTQTALSVHTRFDRSTQSNSKFVLDVELEFGPGVAVILAHRAPANRLCSIALQVY